MKRSTATPQDAVPPLPQAGEGRGEGARRKARGESQRETLEIREGPATPYLAKPQQPRHSREPDHASGGNPVPLVALPDVATLNPRGFDERPNDDDLVSFIPMKAVEEESGRLSAVDTKRWADVKKGYTPFQDGDVIFAKITPCMENGKYALATGLHGGRAAGSTEFHVFRPKPELDSKYLLHFLFAPELRSRARMNMKGAAGQLRVPTQFFNDVQIPLPPLAEQRRIVAELETQLTRLDASVIALKRVQANLKRYRASVLKAACEGRLVPTEAELARSENRIYESGAELLARITQERATSTSKSGSRHTLRPVDTKLSVPEGWTPASGAQLFSWSSGEGLTQEQIEVGPFPVYGGNGVTGHHKTYVAEYPTLVIGRVGALCGNVYLTGGKAWITDNAIYAISGTTLLSLPFARLVFIQANLNKRAAGSGQPFVNQRMLNETPVPLPPLAEQQRIVAEVERRLSVIEELEATVAANLKRAQRLRQSVLARAFACPAE